MSSLLPEGTPSDFAPRAASPSREIGAYEALWAREGAWFKSIADCFRTHAGALPSDFVPPQDVERYSTLALSAIRAAGIERFGVRLHGAGDYPAKLRDAAHPIELLYFQGLWDLVNTRCVAIVGTRHPSDAGKRRAARLARLLAADGFTIVSGLARGIDTAAHRGAIAAGGYTIAVLGTPITEVYPAENRELQGQIAAQHLLVSQVPIVRYGMQHMRARRLFFPERNATISALSEASVIVEVGETSGSLVQGRQALKQGRKLFILDNCFRIPSIAWPARLIEQGAIRVRDYEEIKSHLAARDP
jgi:DNA processing protein